MEDGRQPQSFLDRPVRSLLDLKIGTVLKAYLLYVAVGLLIAVIGLAVLLSKWNSGDSGTGGLGPASLSWGPDAGDTITPAQYRSVRPGARLETVRSRFGEPATIGSNPLDQVDGSEQTCLGYRSAASPSLYLLCFGGGRLVEKQAF